MQKFKEEQDRESVRRDTIMRSRGSSISANIPDVDMESVGSRHSRREYDPDNLIADEPRRPQVATAEIGLIIQRIRVSAIYDLKEFSGKDNDEDRARNWIGKVKSSFLRVQAPESEKCLVFWRPTHWIG